MNTFESFDDFLDASDCYATLGVDSDADAAEIDRAYRAQVQHYRRYLHDANPNVAWEAGIRLSEINAAYAVVGNPARRQRYDIGRRTGRNGRKSSRVSSCMYETDVEDDFSADPANFLLASASSGPRWLSALLHALPKPEVVGDWRFMGPLAKMLLLPIPFCIATMVSALFWRLGELTSQQILGDLTAILAYPLILFASLLRLLLPIRYRPLLSAREKLLWTPITIIAAIVLGWLWIAGVDHAGATMNPLDIYWWCGLIIAVCTSLAYF